MSRHVLVEEHISAYNQLLEYIDEQIVEKSKVHEPGVRTLQKIRRQVRELKNQVPRLKKTNHAKTNRTSGFILKCRISKEMADFLQVDPTNVLSRNEIRNAINAYIRYDPLETREQIKRWDYMNPGGKRNLQDSDNKSVIHPDTTLAELLNYPAYVAQVRDGLITQKRRNKETGVHTNCVITNDQLTYCTIQKLYQAHIIETLSSDYTSE